jgi:hypothetical protein
MRSLVTAAVLVASGTVAVVAAPAASASTPAGSILYDKGGNVFATTPDGATTRQITTDGTTPAADGTGSTGYLTPSQSDDGSVVVAVRNQQVTSPTDQQKYLRGYLWVMDPYGDVIRKINPPQYAYENSTTCGFPSNNPQGIVNAQVSPDGRHVAYTISELIEVSGLYGCYADSSYRTTVVDIDGSNPTLIDDGSTSFTKAEDLEIGSWADSSTLLIDRGSFGSVEDFVVHVPGSSGTHWFSAGSYTDTAYTQPDVRNGILATEGLSDGTGTNVLRLWTTSGFNADPVAKCEFPSTVNASGDALGDPSLSPDGSTVAYQDTSKDGSAAAAGQGIYLLDTSVVNSSCTGATPHLLVAGANDAFWSPASITPPPAVTIGSHPANPTNSTSATFSFTVRSTAGTPTTTCALDSGTPQPCSSPTTISALTNAVHTFTVSATSGGQTATASYTWRVDTTRPAVTMSAPTATALAASSVLTRWSATDTGSGVRSFRQQYEDAAYGGGFSSWAAFGSTFPATTTSTTVSSLAPGYTYCLRVTATDNAGNVGISAPRCFAVALDDRSLSRSSGWSLGTGTAYYLHTVTTTKTRGAKLTRTGGRSLRHVGIVATTCPTCGTVAVYVGTTLIGTVNLAASTTHTRVIKLLAAGGRTGTVTVKVTSSGRLVAIDGLVLSHV